MCRLRPRENGGVVGVSFSDSPAVVCEELARELDDLASVLAATVVPDSAEPRAGPELEILAEATDRGTVPNSVMLLLLHSSLGPHDVSPSNNPDYLRVIAR